MNKEKMLFHPATGEMIPPILPDEFRKENAGIAWLFNPFNGDKRDPKDIASDVFGALVVDPSLPNSDVNTLNVPIGWKLVRIEPTTECLDNMAMRDSHDYGLMDEGIKASIRRHMHQLYEEAISEGDNQNKYQK